MSVRIQLDNPSGYYTNLDFVTGRVILYATKPENLTSITVKLEGESRSMLLRQQGAYRRQRDRTSNVPALEYHKLLYRTKQVFPPRAQAGPSQQFYTLPAGQYEYPFSLKIPFNNQCGKAGPHGGMNGFGGLRLLDQQWPTTHVTKTLPPSWTGIPNMAEIRYYVKVTVQRPGIFRENRRSAVGIRFLPIEPPRPPPSDLQRYARRQHTFQAGGMPSVKTGSGLFSKKAPTMGSSIPPSFEVNARLPNPAILTCRAPVPLRVFIKKHNQSSDQLYLLSLQIELIAYTDVRAEDEQYRTSQVFTIMSAANIFKPIGTPNDAVGTEITIDSAPWGSTPLPPTVPPSFHTCNITRFYELEVKLGIGFGPSVKQISPQTVQLPLRFPVDIFSGIAPPPALLEAMNAANGRTHVPASQGVAVGAQVPPPTPQRPTAQGAAAPAYSAAPPSGSEYDIPPDAPPTYAEAMAENFTVPQDARAEYSGDSNVNGPSQISDSKNPFGQD